MKLLIVTVCLFVVANGQINKLREQMNKVLGECKEIVGASDVDIDNFKYRVAITTTTSKCLAACVNKRLKVQDATGNISPDAAKEFAKIVRVLDDDLYIPLTTINEKCLKEDFNEPNECETGARWLNCLNRGQIDAGLPLILVDA